MQFKNILVPYDESEHARSALTVALDMVGDDPDAAVHVVMVVASDIVPPPILSTAEVFGEIAPDFESYEATLSSVVKRASDELRGDVFSFLGRDMEAVKAKLVIDAHLSSSPVNGIADYATEHGCDLVVMGRRGLGALRGMLGSVSYGVLRSLDMPILTVK